MAKLIFITGISGSGKSETCRRYADNAFVIHADRVQNEAVRRAFPFVKKRYEWHWESWPKDKSTIHIHSLLHLSLETVVPDVRNHKGNVLVEGAILANDWFRNPLRNVLKNFGHDFHDEDVNHLHLNPESSVVFDHIKERAAKVDYRRHELETYPDTQSVQKVKDWFQSVPDAKIWMEMTTNDALDEELNRLLK